MSSKQSPNNRGIGIPKRKKETLISLSTKSFSYRIFPSWLINYFVTIAVNEVYGLAVRNIILPKNCSWNPWDMGIHGKDILQTIS